MRDAVPFFAVRGVVLTPPDVRTWDWPQAASAAGLTTVALHGPPDSVSDFLSTDHGAAYLKACAALGLQVEYELHAAGKLLPRELFARHPAMFRMDEQRPPRARGESLRALHACAGGSP